MMKNKLIYVELKTRGGNGPAWIGTANTSKSGTTIYFDGKAFKSSKGQGIGGNYYELETGQDYWISCIKKNSEDRHHTGSGTIWIDREAIPAYLTETGRAQLPKNLIPADLAPAKQTEHQASLENRQLDKP